MSKQYMQTVFDFYRNPAVPLEGTTPSTPWKYPGTALSASSFLFSAEKPMKVASARWVVAWNPNAGIGYNAVRLIKADSGPSNEVQIAFLNRNNTSTPVVDGADVTAAFQAICAGGVGKYILQQTCGDTASKIYASWIEVVYEFDPAA